MGDKPVLLSSPTRRPSKLASFFTSTTKRFFRKSTNQLVCDDDASVAETVPLEDDDAPPPRGRPRRATDTFMEIARRKASLSPESPSSERRPSSFDEDGIPSELPAPEEPLLDESARSSFEMKAVVERLAERHPLERISDEEREALWLEREHASKFPSLLPTWWLAVPVGDREKLAEARQLLARWSRRDESATKRFRPRQQLHRTQSGSYVQTWPDSPNTPMKKSKRIDPLSTHCRVALELLGFRVTDAAVREYACRRIDEMRDDHLADVVLQLVQALKLETSHDSALARLLVRRALCAPLVIGHRLFWLLRSEMHQPGVCERFGVVLHAFLAACGPDIRDHLALECRVDAILGDVANKIKQETFKSARHKARGFLLAADKEIRGLVEERRAKVLHDRNNSICSPPPPGTGATLFPSSAPSPPPPGSRPIPPPPPPSRGLHLRSPFATSIHQDQPPSPTPWLAASAGVSCCLDPTLRCRGIDVPKCRVLSSKKQPLLVVLRNADPGGDDVHVIYKHGDDLRQDQLTLQLVRFMDELWRNQGLDLQMWPYRCVASGAESGMIEVVREARTTADIQVEYGKGATGAFKDNVVSAYIQAHNVDVRSFERARATFIASCSGYCVATHVLGVGDRHADNIMVTTSGRLFHIDFGHFLGNFKDKFGIKRERSPFVFTPDMKNVMSVTLEPYERQRRMLSQILAEKLATPAPRKQRPAPDVQRLGYHDFENFCCDAYNAVRDKAPSFVVLFMLMLPAGLPELYDPAHIAYMIDQLALDLSPARAADKFRNDIKNAHRDIWRRVDNYFHNRCVFALVCRDCVSAAGSTPPRTTLRRSRRRRFPCCDTRLLALCCRWCRAARRRGKKPPLSVSIYRVLGHYWRRRDVAVGNISGASLSLTPFVIKAVVAIMAIRHWRPL